MSGKYILVNGKPVEEPDVLKWAKWFESADRVVEKTLVGDVEISTVFMALDHGFGVNPPLLYETMVFGGAMDLHSNRYGTVGDAKRGHFEMVDAVKSKAERSH